MVANVLHTSTQGNERSAANGSDRVIGNLLKSAARDPLELQAA